MKLKSFAFYLCALSSPVFARDMFLCNHPYPPTPSAKIDDQSINGVDTNGNGMRDVLDIEMIGIVDSLCSGDKEKESAYWDLFHVFEMMKPTNKVIDLWAVKEAWLRLPCGIGANGYESFFIAFEPTVDTNSRLKMAESHALDTDPMKTKSLHSDQM